MSRVTDILNDRTLFCVETNQSVASVAKRMAELHVGAILVVEGGELRGVFSERDLMTRVVLEHRDPAITAVAEVMTCSNLATVDEFATLDEAMEKMQSCNCRHLPVMRGTEVVGFLSMRDLMNVELERKTEELQHMKAYIHGQ
jgi:signal-transduction protein with cAMP-binding, CBS, and nucleotidyltransferase domain